ncbi:hypothetical protein ACFLTC_03800, partial [Chloroflexota bacterium]
RSVSHKDPECQLFGQVSRLLRAVFVPAPCLACTAMNRHRERVRRPVAGRHLSGLDVTLAITRASR